MESTVKPHSAHGIGKPSFSCLPGKPEMQPCSDHVANGTISVQPSRLRECGKDVCKQLFQRSIEYKDLTSSSTSLQRLEQDNNIGASKD